MRKILGFSMLLSLAVSSWAYASPNTGTESAVKETEAGPNQFAVVCIVNESGIPVNYSYRWGDGSWSSINAPTGNYRWFSWKYAPGTSSSPRFEVNFDYDLRAGRDSRKTYTLDRYAAPFEDCNYGKKYKFVRTGDFIDLYTVN